MHNTSSGKEFTELARRAEATGFSTLFVPDHFVDHELAPTVALAHAAAVTDTLRIGPLVLGNDYKHPVVLAREVGTLDLLSNGRLELGIGAGWMTVDYEKAGIPLDSPGVRIARLAESIAVIKGLLGDGPFTFEGEYYRVTDLDGQPKPVQRPHPPFIVGGGGPKILALAAREAEIVGINANLRSGDGNTPDAAQSLTSAATDAKLASLRAAAGPRFDDLEIQTLVGFVHVADDTSAIVDAIAGSFGVDRDDAQHGAGDPGGKRVGDRRPARTPSRTLADVVRCHPGRRPRRMCADRRASDRELKEPRGNAVAHDRKFRFGVQVSQAASAASWRDRARKIEDLGFSTLFMPDHFGQELAPLPAIAMAAAHTTTLRVGALGLRQRLQASGDPRQGSRDDRPAVRRPRSSSVSARVG